MQKVRLQTKDGRELYGDPYVSTGESRNYTLNNKKYSMQELNECMKAVNKHGLGLLDISKYDIVGCEDGEELIGE